MSEAKDHCIIDRLVVATYTRVEFALFIVDNLNKILIKYIKKIKFKLYYIFSNNNKTNKSLHTYIIFLFKFQTLKKKKIL